MTHNYKQRRNSILSQQSKLASFLGEICRFFRHFRIYLLFVVTKPIQNVCREAVATLPVKHDITEPKRMATRKPRPG